jgi:cathepsin L
MIFKVTILALVAVLVCSNRPTVTGVELEDYTFDKFVVDFNLDFPSHEVQFRETIFQTELQRVKEHNAKNLSWQEGINKFSAMTLDEVKSFRGKSKNAAKEHRRESHSHLKFLTEQLDIKPLKDLPTNVDWREKGVVSPPKDQAMCGSCWAFAATETIESHVAIASGKLEVLSPQQIASCTPNPKKCGGTGGCEGATAELAFDYVSKEVGIFTEKDYPYKSGWGSDYPCKLPTAKPVASIGGFQPLPANDYLALLNAVAQLGPIAISVDATNLARYSSGIYKGCKESSDINHAVVLVGYGEEKGTKYWLVRNSWGSSYGEKGYVRIERTDQDGEQCRMDTRPEDGSACEGDHTPVKVCGPCGILSESSYPIKASHQ